MKPRGTGRVYKRNSIWWIEYWHNGEQHRETSKSTNAQDATRLLKQRLSEIHTGSFIGKEQYKLTATELFSGLTLDYTVNRRRSFATLGFRIAALTEAFGSLKACDINEARIERYKASRLETHKPATVNRELAALKRAFRIACRQKRFSLANVPNIDMLREDNAREGFLDPDDFALLVTHLPSPVGDIARFAYHSGWRRGEVLSLMWRDVDMVNGRVTLRRENSKNNEPRILPLTSALRSVIERRWADRLVTSASGEPSITEWVFHRNGKQVRWFKGAWKRACKQIGKPNLILHDFRRSAVRNMEHADVSQAVAMKITGHKTDSIYRRYRIVDETDLREALERTEANMANVLTSGGSNA